MKKFSTEPSRLLASLLFLTSFTWSTLNLLGEEKKPVKAQAPAVKTAAAEKSAPATEKKTEEKKTGAAPASEATSNEFNKRIVDNLRSEFSIPPAIQVAVVELTPSPIAGLDSVTIETNDGRNINRQQIFLSQDKKFALVARVLDLTVDPYARNISKINLTGAPMRGNKNARVTIVEFSDFQCPFCVQAYRTIEHDVMKQYGDRVRLVYKHFPLPSHPWAENAAVASACAQQQNDEAFWKMYSSYFENQASINPENIKAKSLDFASSANLDTKKFEACYDNKSTLPRVKADMAEAQAVGITGTPLFFVNGRPLSGVHPFNSFQIVIDEELKKPSN